MQTTLARDEMRKLETARFIIYYPAAQRAVVDRFLARAESCTRVLREHSLVHDSDRKMVIVMPDSPFNNAFVAPGALGYEEVSVIPTQSTLDFATTFGLPPDPGLIGCHELVHYVHVQQTSGFWSRYNSIFGHVYTPQIGYDPWFFEGLATHYEARLTGVGRPVWPVFTGIFAAAYAGKSIGGGDLSALARFAPTGHQYLVGSMFFRFLAERYGERAMWQTIASQSRAITGWFFTGTFEAGFGVEFSQLLDEFETWVQRTFPVRQVPASQRLLGVLGNDARYARGRDGTEVWVAEDLDAPPRLIVRDRRGTVLLDTPLVEVVPARTLVQASPLLVSGLSITRDGNEVWLTVIDSGAVWQTPRTLRWRRGDAGVSEVSRSLGPGATIDPTGRLYYYSFVDGDRWSLARNDVQTGKTQLVVDMKPGTYVLGAQISPDGARLAANVWDGTAFVIWVIDAATGRILERVARPGTPVFDASFTDDGRLLHLGVVDNRFQIFLAGQQVSDAPYAILAPREHAGTIRFLDRVEWSWQLAEIPATPLASQPMAPSISPYGLPIAQPAVVPAILTDDDYSALDHLFYPQLRSPSIAVGGGVPHIGLAIGGGDRLGLQRWSLSGYVQPQVGDIGSSVHYGAFAGYMNNMLAPVSIIGEGGFLDWAAPVATDDPEVTLTEERRTRDVSLGASYIYRDTLAAFLGGVYTSDLIQIDDGPRDRVYLGGPNAALSWFSAETTRYTGVRRGIFASIESSYYPHQLSSFSGAITDVGGTLGAVVPLPFGRRHTVTAFARGRTLIAKDDTNLLQVGGDTGFAMLWDRSSKMEPSEFDTSRFPPNLRFVEPMRGYEDYAITTDSVALGEVSWRYPMIIDRGTAHTWFLPASYLRQLDVELFATGAIDDAQDKHYAAGAAFTLRIQFLRIPLAITYQIARRLVDDEALTQFVGVAPDL